MLCFKIFIRDEAMGKIISKFVLIEKTEIEDGSSKIEIIIISRIDEDLYEIQHTPGEGEIISYLKKEFDLDKKQKENILITKKEVSKILQYFLKCIVENQKNNSNTKKRYFLQIGVKDIE